MKQNVAKKSMPKSEANRSEKIEARGSERKRKIIAFVSQNKAKRKRNGD